MSEYVYGNNEILERVDFDTVHYGSAVKAGAQYYELDALGSVMMTTGPGGDVRDRYEYDAYGQAFEGSFRRINDLGYNGKRTDPTTGLIDYGFRDYAPKLGRFTTSDPIQAGLNWYAYVNNDPMNYVDDLGLMPSDSGQSPNGLVLNPQSVPSPFAGGAPLTINGNTTYGFAVADASLANGVRSDASNQLLQQEIGGSTVVFGPSNGLLSLRLPMYSVDSNGTVTDSSIVTGVFPNITPGAGGAGSASQVAADANKVFHIFGNAEHNLSELVQSYGSETNAYNALQTATEAVAKEQGLSGTFETVVGIGSFQVTVRGVVVDGTLKIGTAFIP